MKKLFFAIVLLCFAAAAANATTHVASSCNRDDVLAKYNLAVSGDVIQIPSGDCTWNSGFAVTKSVTIQGNGKSSTLLRASGPAVNIFAVSGSPRITGIGFPYTGSEKTIAAITAGGKGWRIDNCDFTYSTGGYAILARSASYPNCSAGLIDNSNFHNGRTYVDCALSTDSQHSMMAAPQEFGTANAVYMENNTYRRMTNGNSIDSNRGGKWVARFNSGTDGQFMAHGVGHTDHERGTRSWEIYNNTFTGSGTVGWTVPVFLRSGEGLIFNNTTPGTWNAGMLLSSDRSLSEYGTPCDGTDPIDTNIAGQSGWRCRDQAGAGKDTTKSVIVGTYPDFDITWKEQTSSPVYMWNNGKAGSAHSGSSTHIKENRDFYDSYPWTEQTSSSSPFNGTTGVGYGTLARRPSTCTTGVAYWATDADYNWNKANTTGNDGALYKCGPTNTWSLFYVPYEYPHPLRSGVVPPDTTPAAVTNNTAATIQCDAATPLDSMVLSVITNELADCAACEDSAVDCDETSGYDKILAAGFPYAITGGTTHNQTLTNLPCSASYLYRSACKDRSAQANKNATSTASAFTIGAPGGGDSETPVRSNWLPNGAVFPCLTNPTPVTLGLHAEDPSMPIGCKYNVAVDAAYGSMAGTFDTVGGTPVITVDDSYPESNYNTDITLYTGSSEAVGQSFESNGGTLNSVSFYLYKIGLPTGNAVAKFYAHTGTFGTSSLPTGAALATSDPFDVSTLGVSGGAIALKTLAFSGANRIALVDGNKYAVTFEWAGGNSSNKIALGRDNTPSHAGNSFAYASGAWSVQNTRDAVFYVNVLKSGSSNDFSKIANFACGSNYKAYYRCEDSLGNVNTDSVIASFAVAPATPTGQVEFESCVLSAPMVLIDDDSASGLKYISTTTPFAGTATCTVNVAEAGTYRIIARTLAADTGTDSAFLTVNSEPQITWLLNPGPDANAWNIWRLAAVNALGTGTIAAPQYNPYQVALAAGNNTLVFAGREIAKLDYFYVEKVEQIVPPELGGGGRIVGSGHTVLVGGGSGSKLSIP